MKPAILTIFILAFLERTYFDFGPNVELITLSMLASSLFLSKKTSLNLTFLLMAATDLIIGNTKIFLFTWSGFLIPILFLSRLKTMNHELSTLKIVLLGLSSNLFFYFWTNFGVWLLDSWNMYPNTLSGLISSYINGLPFLKLQLQSTIITVPLGLVFINYLIKLDSRRYLLKALKLL